MTTSRFLGASERNALNQLVFGGTEKTDFSDTSLVVGFFQARAWENFVRFGDDTPGKMQEVAQAIARHESVALFHAHGVGTPEQRRDAIQSMLETFGLFDLRVVLQEYRVIADLLVKGQAAVRAKVLEMVDHPERVLVHPRGTVEIAARVYDLLQPFLDMGDDAQSVAARDAVNAALQIALANASVNRMKFLTEGERDAVRTLLSRDSENAKLGDTTTATSDRDLMLRFFNGVAFFSAHDGDSESGLIGHMVSAMCKPESGLIGSRARMDLGEVVLNCIEHLESLDDDRPVAIAQLRETYALPADDVAESLAP